MTDDHPDQGADLRQKIAEALKAAAVACNGHCASTSHVCHNSSFVELISTIREGQPDEVTWVEGTTGALAEVVAAVRDEELEKLRSQVADYENGISWFTTCTGCAKMLDRCYAETVRAETAEAELASAQARIDRVQALHQPEEPPPGHEWVSGGRTPLCQGCSTGDPFDSPPWPCDTIRALDGTLGEV